MRSLKLKISEIISYSDVIEQRFGSISSLVVSGLSLAAPNSGAFSNKSGEVSNLEDLSFEGFTTFSVLVSGDLWAVFVFFKGCDLIPVLSNWST